jgi:AmpD protein
MRVIGSCNNDDMVVDETHCLNFAQWNPSPHCETSSQYVGTAEGLQSDFLAELIVVHCISLPQGQFGTGLPSKLFTGELDSKLHPSFGDLEGLRVSPHVFIDRDGQVEQFVPFDRGAWHAGSSAWGHRQGCNRFSLGIELEGTWHQPFTDAQYRALIDICTALCLRYPSLSPDAIVGHQEIAPGRKEDPGPHFEWPKLLVPLYRRLFADVRATQDSILTKE